jgi:hypothetical protein
VGDLFLFSIALFLAVIFLLFVSYSRLRIPNDSIAITYEVTKKNIFSVTLPGECCYFIEDIHEVLVFPITAMITKSSSSHMVATSILCEVHKLGLEAHKNAFKQLLPAEVMKGIFPIVGREYFDEFFCRAALRQAQNQKNTEQEIVLYCALLYFSARQKKEGVSHMAA